MRRFVPFVVAAPVMSICHLAAAQCAFINFENLAANTEVTTQYPGITFSARNSAGNPVLPPRIFAAGSNTSSPSRALRPVGDGINEFSCDHLRMDFAVDQQLVTFAVGVTTGCTATDTCRVRWYNAAGALLGFRDVRVNGDVFDTCLSYVRVGSRTGPHNIRRIEVEHGVNPSCACAFELIDDIEYDTDATPPIAVLVAPGDRGCVCTASTIQVRGAADDPDGAYQSDRLEYARASDGPWTLIGTATSAAPGPDTLLYNWDTTGLSGWYHLRLTVQNECGQTTAYEEEVYVDANAPGINLRTPVANAIYGGQVCFDGTVSDDCNLGSYTVSYRPSGGGAFSPVSPATPVYMSAVVNDPIAAWQTASGGAAVIDGTYTVRVQATDSCTMSTTVSRNIVIDNTPPVALITSPVNCSTIEQGFIQIHGTASDAHMGGWSLQYSGGDAHAWVTIANGNTNVVDGVLATWDAKALRDCCYVVRLVVTDAANVSCSGGGNSSEYIVSFGLGSDCTQDFNRDGLVNSQDFFDFLNVFFNGCP
jgi:hypothetical protein